ncbi:DNA-binding transcriptional regulator, AcrR family [Streptomyces sp. 3213]|uniref:TetR/AcrR family transcriptional regulator n=1 Tax=Streptomyces sp. 3213.3 TaxID=1855348 RepID=UPI00089BAFFB|nr:TetR/AcrR family transcriptional regulator [Streptomyces sp. 3213.3]SEE88327.1 DNA-binding transcriptional regulator, AcrR family [Streptomyces sp. 3213] [Streptomyces sp. 3213.3]
MSREGVQDGPATARRPGGRTARTRARILGATLHVVARDGIAGLRYEEIAELAGVHRTGVYRTWPDRDALVNAALLQYSGTAKWDDTGDPRHDLVDCLVALAELLSTTTGRAMQRVIQSAQAVRTGSPHGRTLRSRCPSTRIFERRPARLQPVVDAATARGELPPVDGYFLAALLTGPVHLYVSRGLRPFTRAEAERITDVVLAGLRHTAG